MWVENQAGKRRTVDKNLQVSCFIFLCIKFGRKAEKMNVCMSFISFTQRKTNYVALEVDFFVFPTSSAYQIDHEMKQNLFPVYSFRKLGSIRKKKRLGQFYFIPRTKNTIQNLAFSAGCLQVECLIITLFFELFRSRNLTLTMLQWSILFYQNSASIPMRLNSSI